MPSWTLNSLVPVLIVISDGLRAWWENGYIDVGDQMCLWQVWDVGDRFRMLVIDLIHWSHQQIDVTIITFTEKASEIKTKSLRTETRSCGGLNERIILKTGLRYCAMVESISKDLLEISLTISLNSFAWVWIFRFRKFQRLTSYLIVPNWTAHTKNEKAQV